MNDENARQHRREAAQLIASSTGIGLPIGGSGKRARAASPPPPAEPIDYSRPHVEIHADFGAEGYWAEMTDQPLIAPADDSIAHARDGTRYLEIMYGDDQ